MRGSDEKNERKRKKAPSDFVLWMRLLPNRTDYKEGFKEFLSALPNNTRKQSRSCLLKRLQRNVVLCPPTDKKKTQKFSSAQSNMAAAAALRSQGEKRNHGLCL